MFLIIPVFILVQYCRLNTTREWLDTTRTTRTGGETMVYGLYRSWMYGDMHIISNTALQPRQYDPYDPYRSYGSWNNGSRVVQLVNCIDIYILMISNSAELIRPVNGWRDKHAKGNECMFFALKTWIPQSAKHDEYFSFSKCESPKVPLLICSSQTVRLVHHCFTTRTSRTRRGLVHTP